MRHCLIDVFGELCSRSIVGGDDGDRLRCIAVLSMCRVMCYCLNMLTLLHVALLRPRLGMLAVVVVGVVASSVASLGVGGDAHYVG